VDVVDIALSIYCYIFNARRLLTGVTRLAGCICKEIILRIALLEDDEYLAELMSLWLKGVGYDVQLFRQGGDLIRAVGRESYDLLIVDWILPDIHGDEVLKWVREHLDWPIPVLFVTQKDSEEDIVHALELGADDYLSKPVSQQIFLARVKALLRRSRQFSEERVEVIDFPPYQIDLVHRRILRDGGVIELTQKEYELAVFLFNNFGRVVSRGHILESVWGHSSSLNTRTVDTHISRLRSKLDLVPDRGIKLNAIYQHGYRLESVEVEAA
jgi:DNA-binding response OmpR family regulator